MKKGKRSLSGHRIGEWHQKATEPDEKVRKARELREEKGWTYTRIAAALDVPWLTVRDWVNYVTRYDA